MDFCCQTPIAWTHLAFICKSFLGWTVSRLLMCRECGSTLMPFDPVSPAITNLRFFWPFQALEAFSRCPSRTIQWWADLAQISKPLVPVFPLAVIATDASWVGWGAVWAKRQLSRKWPRRYFRPLHWSAGALRMISGFICVGFRVAWPGAWCPFCAIIAWWLHTSSGRWECLLNLMASWWWLSATMSNWQTAGILSWGHFSSLGYPARRLRPSLGPKW